MAVPVRFLAGAAILSGSITLIELHGPGGQLIYLNPAEVSSVREPLHAEHFMSGSRCLIYLTNRNFITVSENCLTVKKKLLATQP